MARRTTGGADPTVQTLAAIQSDLQDLALQLKVLHWNVRGPNFMSVHEQLDRIYADVIAHVDDVAERIVTLGSPAHGAAAEIAQSSRLPKGPAGFVRDSAALREAWSRLTAVETSLRGAIGTVGDRDPVSQDLLIEVAGSIEKHRWMVGAQIGK